MSDVTFLAVEFLIRKEFVSAMACVLCPEKYF
jgi:hypothetical protein